MQINNWYNVHYGERGHQLSISIRRVLYSKSFSKGVIYSKSDRKGFFIIRVEERLPYSKVSEEVHYSKSDS